MAEFSDLVNDTAVETAPETKAPETAQKATNFDDLAALLAGYTEPAKVESVPEPAPAKQPETPPTNTQFPGAPHWYGNPLYYQSGKKQGQLKPPPKNKPNFGAAFTSPNMSVNPEPSTLTADSIISGALFLTLINLLIPMAFSLINNLIVKDKRKCIDYEMLQADGKALKDLETLADKALKHIKVEANPVGIFLFALLGVYGMQFMTVKMLVDNQVKTDNKKDDGKRMVI